MVTQPMGHQSCDQGLYVAKAGTTV